jgi:hypothetical protein
LYACVSIPTCKQRNKVAFKLTNKSSILFSCCFTNNCHDPQKTNDPTPTISAKTKIILKTEPSVKNKSKNVLVNSKIFSLIVLNLFIYYTLFNNY